MPSHQPFGSLPMQAWAVTDGVRVVGGDARCPVFWTKPAAKAFIATHRGHGYQIVRVVLHASETRTTPPAARNEEP